MHRRLIVTAAVLAGLVLGLVFGGTFAGSGPVSLLGESAGHDDPVVSSSDDDTTSSTVADDDRTSTTFPDDDDRTSTTFPDDDDEDDLTSTTFPDGDDDDDDDDVAAATSEVRSFSVSDAATITVRRTGDRLEIVSIDRADGWSQEIKHDGDDKVEVRFEGHDRRVEFRAEVDDGVISTRIRDEAR